MNCIGIDWEEERKTTLSLLFEDSFEISAVKNKKDEFYKKY